MSCLLFFLPAYEVLSDAEKRANYDRFGHEGLGGGGGRGEFHFDIKDFFKHFDMGEDMFEGGFPFRQHRGQAQADPDPNSFFTFQDFFKDVSGQDT